MLGNLVDFLFLLTACRYESWWIFSVTQYPITNVTIVCFAAVSPQNGHGANIVDLGDRLNFACTRPWRS